MVAVERRRGGNEVPAVQEELHHPALVLQAADVAADADAVHRGAAEADVLGQEPGHRPHGRLLPDRCRGRSTVLTGRTLWGPCLRAEHTLAHPHRPAGTGPAQPARAPTRRHPSRPNASELRPPNQHRP